MKPTQKPDLSDTQIIWKLDKQNEKLERLVTLCRELDIEMDGVRCPRAAGALLNGIRRALVDIDKASEGK